MTGVLILAPLKNRKNIFKKLHKVHRVIKFSLSIKDDE
jgi:hypothetical protein